MITRRMYDSTSIADIPKDAEVILAYADGRYANVADAKRRFPKAQVVGITVLGLPDADVCDCENGLLTVEEAARWAAGRVKAGQHPTIYCNRSTWQSAKDAVEKVLHPDEVSWFIAEYDGVAEVPDGAVAKQFASPDGSGAGKISGHYDASVCVPAPNWPGVDPQPKPRGLPVHVRIARRLLARWLRWYVKNGKRSLERVTKTNLNEIKTLVDQAEKV